MPCRRAPTCSSADTGAPARTAKRFGANDRPDAASATTTSVGVGAGVWGTVGVADGRSVASGSTVGDAVVGGVGAEGEAVGVGVGAPVAVAEGEAVGAVVGDEGIVADGDDVGAGEGGTV
jgi:hypothetical protein